MSTKAAQDSKKGKNISELTVSQKINDFLLANRSVIITVCVSILVVFIAIASVSVIVGKKHTAALTVVEEQAKLWEKALADADQTALATTGDSIITELAAVAKGNRRSLAGARANLTIAEIYYNRKDWKNAGEYYRLAALSAPKAYTAPLAWFNAGVCADEAGNADEAVQYFRTAAEHENAVWASRAWFNLGRIEEQRGNKDAAIAAYQSLSELFPDDEYTKLAKSRIIALQLN